jgi:polyhydroxyalkanoate synthesis regulator phasin
MSGSKEEINQKVVNKRLPKIKASISTYVKREKMVNNLNNEISELKKQVSKLSDNKTKIQEKTPIIEVTLHESDKE